MAKCDCCGKKDLVLLQKMNVGPGEFTLCNDCYFKILEFMHDRMQPNDVFTTNTNKYLLKYLNVDLSTITNDRSVSGSNPNVSESISKKEKDDLIYIVMFGVLFIISFFIWNDYASEGWKWGFPFVFTCVSGFLTITFIYGFFKDRNDRINGRDEEYYLKREIEYLEYEKEQAIKSQTEGAPWERYYTFPCPYCGHYKVRPANWEDKQMSVAFWGIASTKIGDHYKCTWCGKTWA